MNAWWLVPFFAGLVLAVVLPLLGAFLHLRREWLAALAFSQIAAAGSLAAIVLKGNLLLGGAIASLLGGSAKSAFRFTGNQTYVLLMLAGWAVSVLLTSNFPIAEQAGHALFDGQLYFAGRDNLIAGLVLAAVALPMLYRLSSRLVRLTLFPDHDAANRQPWRRYVLAFDLLTAAGVALATATIGVMAAFSLVFVPPMLAFRHVVGWRRALVLAMAAGVVLYAAAFATAMAFDQAFGPVQTLLATLAIAVSLMGKGATADNHD